MMMTSTPPSRRSDHSKENEQPLDSYFLFKQPPRPSGMESSPISSRHTRASPLHQRVFHRDTTSPVFMSFPSSGPEADSLPPFSPSNSQKHIHSPYLSSIVLKLQESRTFWLALYFCFNLSLTLYNKSVLVRFPFPYTLTAMHALFGTIGGTFLAHSGVFVPVKLKAPETVVLVVFSILYAFNIVVSNASLQLVTVAVRVSLLQ